jgi:hypothetical protein
MSISRKEYTDLEEKLISELLEERKALRELLKPSETKQKILTYQEKKLLLLELKDISDIVITERGSPTILNMDFHFKPISLYLDSGSYNQGTLAGVVQNMEEQKRPFYHLWRVGLIDFKTSKSVTTITFNNMRMGFSSRYEDELKVNPHDKRMNCWGGWYQTIENLFKEKKFFDAIIHLSSRMKQMTINDGAATIDKLREFNYERKPLVILNDQEAEFFKISIDWLTSRTLMNTLPNDGNFVSTDFMKSPDADTYYIDISFRRDLFKLVISSEAYEQFFRR